MQPPVPLAGCRPRRNVQAPTDGTRKGYLNPIPQVLREHPVYNVPCTVRYRINKINRDNGQYVITSHRGQFQILVVWNTTLNPVLQNCRIKDENYIHRIASL